MDLAIISIKDNSSHVVDASDMLLILFYDVDVSTIKLITTQKIPFVLVQLQEYNKDIIDWISTAISYDIMYIVSNATTPEDICLKLSPTLAKAIKSYKFGTLLHLLHFTRSKFTTIKTKLTKYDSMAALKLPLSEDVLNMRKRNILIQLTTLQQRVQQALREKVFTKTTPPHIYVNPQNLEFSIVEDEDTDPLIVNALMCIRWRIMSVFGKNPKPIKITNQYYSCRVPPCFLN